MAKITIVINTDNAAFVDNGPEEEIAEVLERMARRVRKAGMLPAPMDSNGNTVGSVTYEE